MKPKPFNLLLTEENRAQLEHMRIAFGCRSHADALRALIERQRHDMEQDIQMGVAPVPPVDRLEPSVALVNGRMTPVVSPKSSRKPSPSRLKGEWKAP